MYKSILTIEYSTQNQAGKFNFSTLVVQELKD